MGRVIALLLTLVATVTLAIAGDESRRNKSEGSGSFNVEPPTLKQNFVNDGSAPAAADDAVARLERNLEQATADAKNGERLCKIGVLSKVEIEQRFLKVIQCEAELANARLACGKEKVAELELAVATGESGKDQLASAKAALKQLGEATEAATAKRHRAELEIAEANVRRQEALLKRGVAGKADVDRAEEKLGEVKAQQN